MPHAKRRLQARALHRGEVEGLRFGSRSIEVIAIRDMAFQMMTAGLYQRVIQSEAHGFRYAPRRDPFAAHMIDMHSGFFQDGNREAVARQHGAERTSSNPTADDY